MTRKNYSQIRDLLACCLAFQGNSMSAERRNLTWPNILNSPLSGPINPGRLNEKEARKLSEASDRIFYVIYSYSTPIAWVAYGDDKWNDPCDVYVVEQSFSTTTSRHQGLCRAWL